MQKIKTFLMFAREHHGKAKDAIACYVALFPNSAVKSIEYYKAGDPQPEGTVKVATFTLNGLEYMAIDSAAPHQFTFTPAFSLFVECDTESEIERLYGALSDGGQPLMPLGDYGFSKRFGWVNDRFGVSWQLNLAAQG